VRELENCIERATILCNNGVLQTYHLPPTLRPAEKARGTTFRSLEHALQTVERDLIADTLKANRGNMTKAAAMLGTTERIVGIRVKRYRIKPKSYR